MRFKLNTVQNVTNEKSFLLKYAAWYLITKNSQKCQLKTKICLVCYPNYSFTAKTWNDSVCMNFLFSVTAAIFNGVWPHWIQFILGTIPALPSLVHTSPVFYEDPKDQVMAKTHPDLKVRWAKKYRHIDRKI